MLRISEQINVAPCLLARIVLQCYLQPTGTLPSPPPFPLLLPSLLFSPSNLVVSEERMKSEVSKRIKDPSLIDDERMRKEVTACIDKDDNYSPLVEKIRRYSPPRISYQPIIRMTGLEHENLLQQKLLDLNMPFMSEEDLRNVGYPKTPDVKLLLPFGIPSHSHTHPFHLSIPLLLFPVTRTREPPSKVTSCHVMSCHVMSCRTGYVT